MSRSRKIRYAAAAVCVLAVAGALCRGTAAAVPVSVAVRQQTPAVEQIISQLEAKAVNAKGTWITKSGRQDVPAQEWETGISGEGKNGGAWYWKSLSTAPDPNAGLTLYDDGEDVYVLPYGKDNQQGGLRFQYDTLRRWNAADYLLGHYLLDMNLLPRQFIGALGGLHVVDTEQLKSNGATSDVVHLVADPKEDKLAATDDAVNRKWGIGANPSSVVDLYYDSQKRAIVRIVFRTPFHSDSQIELRVTGWDKLDTNDLWPHNLIGRVIPRDVKGDVILPSVGDAKPVLTTVERFNAGDGSGIEAVERQMKDTAFFATDPNNLRSRLFYMKNLSQGDNVNDRVALGEVSFIEGDVADGLAQWERVDNQLHAAQDHNRLNSAYASVSSGALYRLAKRFASQDKQQRTACAQLLHRLVNNLDDTQFKKAADGVAVGWDELRKAADTKASVEPLSGTLLPKLIMGGDVFVLEELVADEGGSAADASLIDPQLKVLANLPVPDAGFPRSQQNRLILACLRANALDQAKEYLGDLRWNPGTNDTQKQAALLWMQAIPIVEELRKPNDLALEQAITLYARFSDKGFGKDLVNSTYGKWFLARAGTDFIGEKLENKATESQPEELMQQTARAAGASEYWRAVVANLAMNSLLQPNHLLKQISPLISQYAATFGDRNFECSLWLNLSRNRNLAGKYLGIEIQYLNKALVAAPDDRSRGAVINAMASTYARVREFAMGASAVEQASSLVNDTSIKDQLKKTVARLKALQTDRKG